MTQRQIRPFMWPDFTRPGIRYGNLSAADIARLPPVMQQHLTDRGNALNANDVVNAGVPELTLADPVIPPEPSNAPQSQGTYQPMQYASFNNLQLSIGVADQLVLNIPPGDARRVYLFIINTHPLQTMYVAFQVASTVLLGVPINPLFGWIEFNVTVPQDDVHLIANGAATTGVLLFANKTPHEARTG